MAWKIEFSDSAERELDKLDPQISRRILEYLQKRLAKQDNPRNLGAALKGSKPGMFWKYRVGDYRIIASIEDKIMHILVVRISNRRDVYRK